jgi:hypothetical protein
MARAVRSAFDGPSVAVPERLPPALLSPIDFRTKL